MIREDGWRLVTFARTGQMFVTLDASWPALSARTLAERRRFWMMKMHWPDFSRPSHSASLLMRLI
jgi:hypothetical protein